jgi:protein-S-isoprenylcysteine O-methyltransferase Ste14
LSNVPRLGERGGGWVVLQFAFMACVFLVAAFGPRWPTGLRVVLVVVGAALLLLGAAVVIAASRALGKVSPFPRPPRSGQLTERGPFRIVRHPLYLGALVFFLGISLLASPLALVPVAALAVVFGLKSAVEESFLHTAYPAYRDYCRRTRYRLIPFVY